MKKFKLIFASLIIIGAVLLVASSTPPAQKAQAAVPYPVPLRSWIKTGAVAYQPPASMTPEKIEWAAAHFDFFDSPNPQLVDDYSALTTAPLIVYDNYYCLYVGGDKYNAMVDYVNSHGLNLEDMFVHYSEDTQVTYGSETHVLPAGSRVPTYNWYGTGGDLTKKDARVVMNVGNPDYRAFNTQRQLNLTNTDHNGATYDGIFVDNSGNGILTAAGGAIGFGGSVTEYPGDLDTRKAAYDADIVKAFQEVRNAFGPKGTGKMQVPNIGNGSTREDLFTYVEGVFREFSINPLGGDRSTFENFLLRIQGSDNASVISYNSALNYYNYSTNTTDNRHAMTTLAIHYSYSSPFTYLVPQASNPGDLQTYAWFPAVEYDIGQPKGAITTFATGVDPSSTKKDTGEGIVTSSGAIYTLTDTSKSWSAEYWQGLYMAHSSNQIIGPVRDSGSNTIQFYRATPPYPVSGHYEVGSFIYKIYSREFDKALVVFKPAPAYNDAEMGDASATAHNLPATADNPSGRYYQLNADGTINNTPLTQISLKNREGVILIKESVLQNPTVSKSVDRSSASSGDTLTYTISYSNPTQTTFTNAILDDPIPNGTTYVNGSATGGGNSDGTKVIWNLGDLASGANGTVSFQVTIN